MRIFKTVCFSFIFFASIFGVVSESTSVIDDHESVVIVTPVDASSMEKLAAKEIRRYLYLRTEQLVPIREMDQLQRYEGDAIVVGRKERFQDFESISPLGPQEFILKTIRNNDHIQLIIAGGDELGTLYGAYRFVERLGVRFYLHGDVVPDEKIEFSLLDVEETGKPLFELRGIQPFHDFPEGPDWWNEEEYKSIFAQLVKLRMNFFGLHTYPEGHPNAEPTVWIGLKQDINPDGTVKFSYPSSYQNTQRGNWGYEPKLTGEYAFGGEMIYENDVYGAEVMGDSLPRPETLEECNAVFNRTGELLQDVFTFAQSLGIKTCVGTETPLTVPERVQAHMAETVEDASDVVQLYEGMFERIMRTYPIDYYWFWTPEGWIWRGSEWKDLSATKMDLFAALEAAERVDVPFTLATCGWVLGPQNDRAMFDRLLPKEMPMSCINRLVGFAPVQRAFAKIEDRPLWAIPWMEDDPALLQAQLWVGRMRADAVDAKLYGCNGLMGIHWRTRILGPNVSALAWAAWDQSEWYEGGYDDIDDPSKEGPIGGGQYARIEDESIVNPLYQTVRDHVYGYRLAVPNGRYIVTLKFVKPERKISPTERYSPKMFSVNIQGKNYLEKLNLDSDIGESKKIDYTFSSIPVTDGMLTIEFPPMQSPACIAAISVHNNSYAKRINCGGPAYQGYQADWPPSKPKPRHLPAGDFYRDWARQLFGTEAAKEIAEIFTELDGNLPRPIDWVGGPGGINPDDTPWSEVRERYDFISKLAALRDYVKGSGNRERFDYWLDNFKLMHACAKVKCIWGEYNTALEEVKKIGDAAEKREQAINILLPIRKRLVEATGLVCKLNLQIVSNTGEMGTVTNWEQHTVPHLLTEPGEELAEMIGRELPSDAQLGKPYDGPPRVFVLTPRSLVYAGETVNLKVVILDNQPPQSVVLKWREMGIGQFRQVVIKHVARGVYETSLPVIGEQMEYYVQVRTGRDETICWPITAPEINQTVTVISK